VRVTPHVLQRIVLRVVLRVVLLLATLATGVVGATTARAQTLRTAVLARRDTSSGVDHDWHRDQCLGGLTYGAPLKLAASWAGGFRKDLVGGDDVCAFVSPKLGLGGARLNVGLARTLGTVGSAIGVSSGMIRTFGAPSHADRMSTYAGASLHVFPILAIGLELGWYRRLGGTAGVGRESIVVWSAGLGF
jgi:hypothetical protein